MPENNDLIEGFGNYNFMIILDTDRNVIGVTINDLLTRRIISIPSDKFKEMIEYWKENTQ